MRESETVSEACPQQSGVFSAYKPEYKEKDGDWKPVPTTEVKTGFGIPHPGWNLGIDKAIGLFGYSQAQALAWGYAALYEEIMRDIEVRVVEYRVNYNIEAREVLSS